MCSNQACYCAGSLLLIASVAVSANPCQPADAECGQAPPILANLYADLITYQLPPFDQSADELAFIRETQVSMRSQDLQLDAASPYALLSEATTLYQEITESRPAPETIVRFNGTRSSELTTFLAGKSELVITMNPSSIVVDEPIVLQGDGITLDATGATFDTSQYTGNYVVWIEGHERIRICNLQIQSVKNNGILVSDAHHVAIAGGRFEDVAGNPLVVVGDTDHFDIQGNQFLRSGRAAIHVESGPENGVIRDNLIQHGMGHSNFHAGILLSDRGGHDLHEPQEITPDGYWNTATKIVDRKRVPKNIIIYGNVIEGNLSSGIYSDGACRNLIVQNRILGNSKEGICLDNGSTANVVGNNEIQGNGQRYGQTDEQLALDFVLSYGRMDDGTAKAKVPGVSIDNALFNIVLENTIRNNYGSGIKMVRTGSYNIITMNLLDSNNAGQNDRFHFFGIELGAAASDVPSEELDFTPSCGNIIAGNQIRGSHYAGLYFAGGSILNNVFDNVIVGQIGAPVEPAVGQHNTFVNNTPSDFFNGTLFNRPLFAPCGAGIAGTSLTIMLGLLSVRFCRVRIALRNGIRDRVD